MKALVQINRNGPCPVLEAIAKEHNYNIIWFDHQQNHLDIRPDLVIVQCAVQKHHFHDFGWQNLHCPIIASCGDAATITNLNAVRSNLPILTELYVEGYDYFDYFKEYQQKLKFFKICSDTLFYITPNDSPQYDWVYAGQVYPEYDVRLKHYRTEIVPELKKRIPNGLVIGQGWDAYITGTLPHLPQEQLNQHYANSKIVISIDAHNGAGYTSTRTIEAMWAGCCTFIYDHEGMWYLKQFIEDGIHAYYFKDLDELQTKFELIDNNYEKRQQIGKAAHDLVQQHNWTYSGWLRSIFRKYQ